MSTNSSRNELALRLAALKARADAGSLQAMVDFAKLVDDQELKWEYYERAAQVDSHRTPTHEAFQWFARHHHDPAERIRWAWECLADPPDDDCIPEDVEHLISELRSFIRDDTAQGEYTSADAAWGLLTVTSKWEGWGARPLPLAEALPFLLKSTLGRTKYLDKLLQYFRTWIGDIEAHHAPWSRDPEADDEIEWEWERVLRALLEKSASPEVLKAYVDLVPLLLPEVLESRHDCPGALKGEALKEITVRWDGGRWSVWVLCDEECASTADVPSLTAFVGRAVERLALPSEVLSTFHELVFEVEEAVGRPLAPMRQQTAEQVTAPCSGKIDEDEALEIFLDIELNTEWRRRRL